MRGLTRHPPTAPTRRRSRSKAALSGGASTPSLVIPNGGGEGRPLLVFLHGRGNDERSYLEYESLFEALESIG